MANVVSYDWLKALLQVGISGTVHPLGTLHVGLYTNNVTLDENTVLSDLVQPTYSGYALASITLSTIYDSSDGSLNVQGGLSEFQMSDTDAPTQCYGYFVEWANGSLTELAWAEPFANGPLSLTTTDDAIIVGPSMKLSADSDYGTGTVLS